MLTNLNLSTKCSFYNVTVKCLNITTLIFPLSYYSQYIILSPTINP